MRHEAISIVADMVNDGVRNNGQGRRLAQVYSHGNGNRECLEESVDAGSSRTECALSTSAILSKHPRWDLGMRCNNQKLVLCNAGPMAVFHAIESSGKDTFCTRPVAPMAQPQHLLQRGVETCIEILRDETDLPWVDEDDSRSKHRLGVDGARRSHSAQPILGQVLVDARRHLDTVQI